MGITLLYRIKPETEQAPKIQRCDIDHQNFVMYITLPKRRNCDVRHSQNGMPSILIIVMYVTSIDL